MDGPEGTTTSATVDVARGCSEGSSTLSSANCVYLLSSCVVMLFIFLSSVVRLPFDVLPVSMQSVLNLYSVLLYSATHVTTRDLIRHSYMICVVQYTLSYYKSPRLVLIFLCGLGRVRWRLLQMLASPSVLRL